MILLRLGVAAGFLCMGMCVLPQLSIAALSSEHFVLDAYTVGDGLGMEKKASTVYTVHTAYGTEYIVAQPSVPPVPEPEPEVDQNTTQQGSRRRLDSETEFIGGGTTTPITGPSLLDMLREAQDPRLTGVHERAFELAHGIEVEGNTGATTTEGVENTEGNGTQSAIDGNMNGLAAGIIQSGTQFAAFFASFWARFGLLLLVLIALWYVRTRTLFGRKYGPF